MNGRSSATDLSGKQALVTGASRGIGAAIACSLARQGAQVAVHYGRDHAAAKAVVDRIGEAGGRAFPLQADLSTSQGARGLLAAYADAVGAHPTEPCLDILVNNAGIGMRVPMEDLDEKQLDSVLQINFKSPFFIMQAAASCLRDGGRIINISSMASRVSPPGMVAYAASKAALETVTTALAKTLGPRGITVNAVLPGATETDMNIAVRDPAQRERIISSVALRRIGRPEDVSDVVLFLASEQGRWVTGQRLDASGGQQI